MLVSVVKAMELMGSLFFLNLPINSAAKCCESAAEPPLPQKNTVPPSCTAFKTSLAIIINTDFNCFCSCATWADSSKYLSIESIISPL